MLKNYIKKPIKISAMKLENTNESIIEAFEWVYDEDTSTSMIGQRATIDMIRKENGLVLETLKGNMLANFGDYIIKGANDEFYPCPAEIFEKTYKEV